METPAEPSQTPEDPILSAGREENGGTLGTHPDGQLPIAGGPILSESLFRGRSEVQILHRGEFYRLCLTRAGKLILHK